MRKLSVEFFQCGGEAGKLCGLRQSAETCGTIAIRLRSPAQVHESRPERIDDGRIATYLEFPVSFQTPDLSVRVGLHRLQEANHGRLGPVNVIIRIAG
jgi:hypothetical protein